MVMHDVQNESLVFLYQLGTLSPLPSGEKEVSQTPHCIEILWYASLLLTFLSKNEMNVVKLVRLHY